MAIETKSESAASFLLTPVTQEHFLTLEKLDDEQQSIRESAATFIQREVLPLDRADRAPGARRTARPGQKGRRARPADD